MGIVADALDLEVARSGAGLEVTAGRRLNVVIDGDVVQIEVMASNAHNVAGLLDGRIRSDFADPVRAGSPAGVDAAEDMNLTVGTARDVNLSGSIGDRQIYGTIDVESALKSGFCGEDRQGAEQQSNCRNPKSSHRISRFKSDGARSRIIAGERPGRLLSGRSQSQ